MGREKLVKGYMAMLNKLNNWAEKKTIKTHIERWLKFRALQPEKTQTLDRLKSIERELLDAYNQNPILFDEVLNSHFDSSSRDQVYRMIDNWAQGAS